jgi:EmrB/QacA subfamily drug resistance transporter
MGERINPGLGVPARRLTGRHLISSRTVLLVASLGSCLVFLDASIVNIAFPDLRRSFPDSDIDDLSWVLNAYGIVFAAFFLVAGRFADLVGRRRMFEVGVVLFTLASLLCAGAPSLGWLVAARVLQALGGAAVVSASLALVLEAFTGEDRIRGVALWSSAAALAAGIGPSLGGALVELESWRLIFLVNLPLGIFTLWIADRTFVESRAPSRRGMPDLAGSILLALAIGLLTLGIINGDDWGWASPGVIGSLALAGVLGALFVSRCSWHRSPMLDLHLFRIRSLAVSNVLTLLGAAGFFAYGLCNVLFLTSVWGYTVLEAALALTPGPFIAAGCALVATRLGNRLDQRLLLLTGALVWSAGLVYLIVAVGTEPAFLSEWLPGVAIIAVGFGIAFPMVESTAVAAVSVGRFATASGLNSVARQIGGVLGVAILVAIIGTPSPEDLPAAFDRGWAFAAACCLGVAVGSLALGKVSLEEVGTAAEVEARPSVLPPGRRAEFSRSIPILESLGGPHEPAEFLRGVPLFAGLSDDALDSVLTRASFRQLLAGEFLFHRGDIAESLFIVVRGRLDVIREGHEVETLRVLGPETVIGDLALLAASTRSASVRARRDSELLELTKSAFDDLIAQEPGFAGALLGVMATELQESRALDPQRTASPSAITVVPLSPGLPVRSICSGLIDTLSLYRKAVLVEGPSEGDTAIEAELLERHERAHHYVVLLANPNDPWCRFSIRHADRVVAIATGDVPDWVNRRPDLRGCDLLFLEGEDGEPIGPWLDALQPRARHVLLPGDGLQKSIEAAGRRIVNRSVGVVLSGGGARALAHVGVLEELFAAGITIDRVGGCSMGAFVGALLASGMNPGEIDACCYEEWVRHNPLRDYRLPRVSLIRGQKVRELLERNLPRTIEDLPLDYFCVTGDLVSGDLIAHRRGSLVDAVGASMSIPGLVPPLVMGDQLLVDGGVLNNLPVDIMAATGEGPVIAVDVTAQFTPPVRRDNGALPGARRGWMRRARHTAPTDDDLLPRLAESLIRGLLLGSVDTSELAREHADLVITPEDGGVGLFEFHQLDLAKEAGRRAAREALETAPPTIFA